MIYEFWKDIDNCDPGYEISSKVRVRSKGKVHTKKVTPGGYPKAHIRNSGKTICPSKHTLMVEELWVEIPDGYEVKHIDGNKLNCALENFEVVTKKYNHKHARDTGLINNRGENNHFSKLKVRDVFKIRFLRDKMSVKNLALCFGVSDSNIRQILSFKTWRSQ